MKPKVRSGSFYGGPANIPEAQLALYGDLHRQWAQSRLDLETSAYPQPVKNIEVAKHVRPNFI